MAPHRDVAIDGLEHFCVNASSSQTRDYSSGVTEDASKSCNSMVGHMSVKNSNSAGKCEGLVGKRPQFNFNLRKIRRGQLH